MEKLPHQEYRDNLAKDLKKIRNNPESENTSEDARNYLKDQKETPEYKEALAIHLDEIKGKTNVETKHEAKTKEEMVESLWASLEPDLENEARVDWEHFVSKHAHDSTVKNITEEEYRNKWRSRFVDKLIMGSFEGAKKELGDKVLIKLSEPSKFDVMFREALIKHSAVFKRENSSEFQEEVTKIDPDITYDFETDIQETEEQEKKDLNAEYKLEMMYWDALNEGRLEQAQNVLNVIESDRKDASEELKQELLNWKLNLSLRLNDIAMFKRVFKEIESQSDQVENFREVMSNVVKQFITKNLLSDIKIKASTMGLEQARKSEKDYAEYFEELVNAFLKDAFLEVVDTLSGNPDMDLIAEAKSILSDKRETYLRVNPVFDDLIFVGKEQK